MRLFTCHMFLSDSTLLPCAGPVCWVLLQIGSAKEAAKGKRTKAAAWGIRVLSEEEFFAAVEKLSRQ